MFRCNHWILFLYLIFISELASPLGINVSYGVGKPNELNSYRIAANLKWLERTYNSVRLDVDCDFGINYLTVNSRDVSTKSLVVVALTPMFYLKRIWAQSWIDPYIAAGVGPAYLTRKQLGDRDLGGHFGFQDLIGLGVRLGKEKKLAFSYAYMHYSNAGIFKPNHGIDIKHLFSFSYSI
jgi:lipid A 3-O-deacylase